MDHCDSPPEAPARVGVLHRTYRYRIYPTKAQERLLNDTLFLCSLVYNQSLAEWKEAWEQTGEGLSAWSLQKRFQLWVASPPWAERVPNAPSLAIVDAHARDEVGVRLERAFQAFFRRVKAGEKPGYPRFRSARRYDSIRYRGRGFRLIYHTGTRLNGGDIASGFEGEGGPRYQRLRLVKVGNLKIRLHRPLAGRLKICTILRTAGGWYACIVCEVAPSMLPKSAARIGLDVGLEHWVTTSDGEHIAPSHYLRKAERRLRVAQRRVRRRQGGHGKPSSKRRKKAVRELARAYQHVANQRRDTAHKAARDLVGRYGLIAVEKLKIELLLRNHRLAKSISDAAWGQFLTILADKAEGAGRQVVQVNPRGTSQRCSGCGVVVRKPLQVREHCCPDCGLHLQRDVNAARNVLADALQMLGLL